MVGSHFACSFSSYPKPLCTRPSGAAPAVHRPRSLVVASLPGVRSPTAKNVANRPFFYCFSSASTCKALLLTQLPHKPKLLVAASSSPEGAVEIVVEAENLVETSEVAQLKGALVDAFYGTELGLKASSETRAEIVELITQLEAKNPTAAPTEALTLLDGKWILAYTSFLELFPLLSTTLSLVKVEKISQTIDSANFTVENSIQFSGPLATTSLSTNAKFEIRSPKRVQIKFEEGVIGTPQLTDSIEIPENVEFLGQRVDLSPLKGLMTPVQDAASSVAKRISDQPPLKFPITSDSAQSWLLTTYLDHELRISRADGNSVFVLFKEGSSLLK